MRTINRFIVSAAVAASVVFSASLASQAQDNPPPAAAEPLVKIIPYAEFGAVAVLDHVYRSGSTASGNVDFNYRTQGGQEILFPYARFAVDAVLGGQSIVTFLYQPLTIDTTSVAGRNGTGPVQIDGVVFPAGTPFQSRYGFDFWRLSYMYDFLPGPDILGAGISLQLRNASVSFTSTDGSLRAISQNLGPVPILKFRAAHWFAPLFGIDFIADGFYASSAIFNGSGKPFEGWVWDASVSFQTRLIPAAVTYLTVRSIGGGANGSNAYDATAATVSVNKETYNRIATVAVTLGLSLDTDALLGMAAPR